jgi:ribosomal protein S18 acetylase RimI-like enzyme
MIHKLQRVERAFPVFYGNSGHRPGQAVIKYVKHITYFQDIMVNIDYFETGAEGIDLIRPLWEQLVLHHGARSLYFKDFYETFTFEKRKADLLKKSGDGLLRVDIARDHDRIIGYCISSVKESEGEIDSIFVEQGYRSSGIGNALMDRAMAWMDGRHATVRRVAVAMGNEDVFGFYEKFGFLPRQVILEQKRSP